MMSKRTLLVFGAILILALALSACAAPAAPAPAAGEQPTAEGGEAADEAAGEAAAGATGELEVFSWWTSGGEAAALDALFQAYSAQYPDVEIINATVAGGGGSAARGVLQSRLAGAPWL
jgi:glucose/mannose transport system substrate-binding protein